MLRDGQHDLRLYEWDRSLLPNAAYLRETDPKRLRPLKDTMQVRSLLSSTIMTQNDALSKVRDSKGEAGRSTPRPHALTAFVHGVAVRRVSARGGGEMFSSC